MVYQKRCFLFPEKGSDPLPHHSETLWYVLALKDLVESGREREQDLLKELERAHRDLAEMAAQRKKEKDSADGAETQQDTKEYLNQRGT